MTAANSQSFQTLDPRIGMLSSGKYYCFPTGYGSPEFIGTLEDVQRKLGLPAQDCSAPRAQEALTPARSGAAKEDALKSTHNQRLRHYEVTVSPKVVAFAGTWRGDSYRIVIAAQSRSEAISRAREMRRQEEGRFAVSATFSAKVLFGSPPD